jgi:hypothetical protein
MGGYRWQPPQHATTETRTFVKLTMNLKMVRFGLPSFILPFTYRTNDRYEYLDGWYVEGQFVDLVLNPERFTGYAGASASKVWSSIYEENCFGLSELAASAGSSSGSSSSLGGGGLGGGGMSGADGLKMGGLMGGGGPGLSDGLGTEMRNEAAGECLEKKIYYRIISGEPIRTSLGRRSANDDADCFSVRVVEQVFTPRSPNTSARNTLIKRRANGFVPCHPLYLLVHVSSSTQKPTRPLLFRHPLVSQPRMLHLPNRLPPRTSSKHVFQPRPHAARRLSRRALSRGLRHPNGGRPMGRRGQEGVEEGRRGEPRGRGGV